MKKYLLMLAIFFAFLSCEKSQNPERNNELNEIRTEFIKGKSEDVIVETFKFTPFDIKTQLWVDKLNGLLKQNFSKHINKKYKRFYTE